MGMAPTTAAEAPERRTCAMRWPSVDWRFGQLIPMARICGLSLAVGLAIIASARGQAPSTGDNRIVPIDTAACNNMKAHQVLGPRSPVGCDRLTLVKFSYFDFEGRQHVDGEIVVMDAAAKYVEQIFDSLRRLHFPVAKARVMDHYDGNDDASMNDNNTSAFNDREIVGGGVPSLHAYGLAIDLNPVQNPFVTRDIATFTLNPRAGADYANRLNDRPWKARRPGMAEAVVDIFAQNGFLIWGGYWDSPIDYQHFQVSRKFAEQLAHDSPADAGMAFDDLVARYRHCRHSRAPKVQHDPVACIVAVDPAGNKP
jgi:D-alanyl-D-alanine carboxypeptidase-like protein